MLRGSRPQIMNIEKLIKDLERTISSFKFHWKNINLSEYDDKITYNIRPKLHELCPHCNGSSVTWIKEVLEDAILKVKCTMCQNNYYKDFSK